MAAIRLQVDEVKLCVKDTQLYLRGVRRDSAGRVLDHIDLILPWTFERAVANIDAINSRAREDDDSSQ